MRVPGSKLLGAAPFAACPGEAGIQRFAAPAAKAHGAATRIDVAFAVWNGQSTIVTYRRPAQAKWAPGVRKAVAREVCTTP